MDPTLQAVLAASASFLAVTLIFAIFFVVCKFKRKRIIQTRTVPHTHGRSSVSRGETASFDPSLSQISMRELVESTRNFAPDLIIGDGSFGLVYKARLYNGVTVAVKKLSKDAFQGLREFQAEMETLGKLDHQNVVKILAYCVSGADRILIYEFIERGSLDNWLHGTSPEDDTSVSSVSIRRWPLSWEARIKIARGVAMGLSYLHNSPTPIIHRDIKASNVLLDSDFQAHIADFGLARRMEASHSHVSTQVAGTMGYMPPEYKDGAMVATVNADVYSFGVLMLEVATGKRPNWPIKLKDGKEVGLVEWSKKMMSEGRETEIIDPTVPRDGLREAEAKEFLRIASLCAADAARERPAMSEVVALLNQMSV